MSNKNFCSVPLPLRLEKILQVLLPYTRLAFKKNLEPSHGVLQCFIIAFAEATLFSVSWVSSSENFLF